jgi:V/A-type H+-transporting ATPase subunit E
MHKSETGKDKIQRICDVLKKETLEPARQEAREIVENAHMQAQEVIEEAKKWAAQRGKEVDQEIEEKKRIFQASLHLACRQGVEKLKQLIEKELFDKQLTELVAKEMVDPKMVAHLIESFLRAMEAKGVEEDFVATIPAGISPRAINALLTQRILEKLQKHSVMVGDFDGGAKVRLVGREITIDMSDGAVREIIAQYIRRDFREMIFHV